MGYNSSVEAEDTYFVQILDPDAQIWLPHAGPMDEDEAEAEIAAVAEKWGVQMRLSLSPYPEEA